MAEFYAAVSRVAESSLLGRRLNTTGLVWRTVSEFDVDNRLRGTGVGSNRQQAAILLAAEKHGPGRYNITFYDGSGQSWEVEEVPPSPPTPQYRIKR